MSRQKAGPAIIGRIERHKLQDLSNGIYWCARGADGALGLGRAVRRAVLLLELCGLAVLLWSCVECFCHRLVREMQGGCYVWRSFRGRPVAKCMSGFGALYSGFACLLILLVSYKR